MFRLGQNVITTVVSRPKTVISSAFLLLLYVNLSVAFADVGQPASAVATSSLGELGNAQSKSDLRFDQQPFERILSPFSGVRPVNNVPKNKNKRPDVFYGMKREGYDAAEKNIDELYRSSRKKTQKRTKRLSRKRRYRTVCVRLCDGHFFPVGEKTSFRNLKRDADICDSRCTVPSRLYIAPTSKDPQAARTQYTSLDGQLYRDLKTAYLYRTQYVKGCTCMPEPGSVASVKRHKIYAERQNQQKKLKFSKRRSQRASISQTPISYRPLLVRNSRPYAGARPAPWKQPR